MKYFIFLTLLPLIAGKPLDEFSKLLSNDVPLVTFDGAESTTFRFIELDDPVMVSYFKVLKIKGYKLYFDWYGG